MARIAADYTPKIEDRQSTALPFGRLVSLDVIRGITIAFMILVNNDGSGAAYWPLKHSRWNGCTPTDVVFPAFLFLAGVSMVFSIESRLARGQSRRHLFVHTLGRTAILFLLGLVVNGFPYFPLATWRIYGVLQRIAICYLLASALYLWNRRAWVAAATAAAALAGYWVLMRWIPIPGIGVPTRDVPLLDPNLNWVAWLDLRIFPGRLYEGVRDPEGLLSTVPALATILFGALAGIWLRQTKPAAAKARGLLLGALAGLALGGLWNPWFPINKKLWTSSFVLFTAGATLLIFALCYFLIEVKGWKRGWTKPWLVFGSNAIAAYVLSELLASTLGSIHLRYGGRVLNLQQLIFVKESFRLVSPAFASLLYSLSFVLVCFVPIAVLYRKRIFIKV